MFKELGEFIDNVGRTTGYMVKKIFSDDDCMELTGDIDGLPDDIPEELKDVLNESRTIITVRDNDSK